IQPGRPGGPAQDRPPRARGRDRRQGPVRGRVHAGAGVGRGRAAVTGPEVPADSAGVPWGGRSLPGGDFADDDGTADAALRQALDECSAGRAGETAVVRALADARVLVPVVAVRVEEGGTVHGTSDRQADMALVTLTGPDGRRALPVFTSVQSLAAWD